MQIVGVFGVFSSQVFLVLYWQPLFNQGSPFNNKLMNQ